MCSLSSLDLVMPGGRDSISLHNFELMSNESVSEVPSSFTVIIVKVLIGVFYDAMTRLQHSVRVKTFPENTRGLFVSL